jgi:hypothetical protein
VLIIRQPNTYVTSSHKVGFVDTLALYDVYMTRVVNSLDRIFNGYWKSLASRMYAQPAKIHNLKLRTLVHTNPPQNMTQAKDIIDNALATAMHAMQTIVATTLRSTPGALAFEIGRPLRTLVNIMLMRIYNVPIGSNVSMTPLWDNKF